MSRRAALVAAAALAGVAGLTTAGSDALAAAQDKPAAPASQSPSPAPVTLRYAFKPGEVSRYRSVTTISYPDDAVASETRKSEWAETVHAVAPDGAFTLATGAGDNLSLVTYDKNGRFVGQTTGGKPADGVNLIFGVLNSRYVPDKPVTTGETWRQEFDNPVVKDAKIPLVYTYLGSEKLLGRDTHKLKLTIAIDKPITAETEVVRWLDAQTGQTVKATRALKGIPSLNGISHRTTETVLVIPGVNDKEAPGEPTKDEKPKP